MSVLDEVVNSIIRYYDDGVKVVDVRVGIFYTGVKLSSGHGGVAFTPRKAREVATCCKSMKTTMPLAGMLSNKPIEEIVKLVHSSNPFEKAVGVATINALSSLIFEKRKLGMKLGADPLEVVEPREDDIVTMIGAFHPYIKKLKDAVKRLNVFDTNLRAVAEAGMPVNPLSNLPKSLKESTFIIATGSTLVNGTLDEILEYSHNAREFILVGPTASVFPEALFRHGVTCVGGVIIHDADRMLEIVSQAGGGYSLLKNCAEKYTIRRGEE